MATEFMTQVAKLEGYQEDQAKNWRNSKLKVHQQWQMFRLTTLQDNTITTSLQYANGQITLNGQKMPLEDFVGMFAMPALKRSGRRIFTPYLKTQRLPDALFPTFSCSSLIL